jgi:hypothetical protein
MVSAASTSKRVLRWIGYGSLIFATIVALTLSFAWLRRDEIRQSLVEMLNSKVRGHISVEGVNVTMFHSFPDLTITLVNVGLHDTTLSAPVVSARKMFLNMGLFGIFSSEVDINSLSIEDGEVFLVRTSSGYVNTSAFHPVQDSAKSSGGGKYKLNIKAFSLSNIRFVYHDSLKNKRIAFHVENAENGLKRSDSVSEISMKGMINCDGLIFNQLAGSFLENKRLWIDTKLRFNDQSQQLEIMPTLLVIEQNKLHVDGLLSLGEEGLYTVRIASAKMPFEKGLCYLTPQLRKRLSVFAVSDAVDVSVLLKGSLRVPGEPWADIVFSGDNVDFLYEKLAIKNLAFAGKYEHRPLNGQPGSDLSAIRVESFRGKFEGMDVTGSVTFSQLNDVLMDLEMSSTIGYRVLNTFADTTEWVARSGTFASSVRYTGKVAEYLDSRRYSYEGKLKGTFTARAGSFIYKPRNLRLQMVDADFRFTGQRFTVENLSMKVNDNAVSVKGSIVNYIPFFVQPLNKGFVTLTLSSPQIDLSFLAENRQAFRKKESIEPARKRIAEVLNTIQQKLQFDVQVSVDDLRFKTFRANDVRGRVRLDAAGLEAPDIRMKVAQGSMATRFRMSYGDLDRRQISARTKIESADIREFFEQFNNFNQNTVKAENLEGRITATADFSAMIRPDYSVDAETMKGSVTCRIRDGKLINFEPMENLSNFLFRKRDFSEVQFAELKSSFGIQGTDIDIDKMEVQSTVLSFFLQGRYSFSDSTSLSLQLPLNNLKKRDRNYQPENIGTDGKTGMSVFLHIHRDKDINSKINIDYDPFKKWAKKAEADGRGGSRSSTGIPASEQ